MSLSSGGKRRRVRRLFGSLLPPDPLPHPSPVDLAMALLAQRLPVLQVKPEVRELGPRLDVVRMEAVLASALAASVLIPGLDRPLPCQEAPAVSRALIGLGHSTLPPRVVLPPAPPEGALPAAELPADGLGPREGRPASLALGLGSLVCMKTCLAAKRPVRLAGAPLHLGPALAALDHHPASSRHHGFSRDRWHGCSSLPSSTVPGAPSNPPQA